jgi:ribosomal protein L37AE/L43A
MWNAHTVMWNAHTDVETNFHSTPSTSGRDRIRNMNWPRPADDVDKTPVTPAACPFCQSPNVKTKTAAGKVDANSYWRCEACGEMWNAGRLAVPNHNRYTRR